MSLNSGWTGNPLLKKRFVVLALCATGFFLLLVLRLWYLQIIRADHYRNLAERNRTRYIPIVAPRGGIYDRNGQLLADNRPAFDISVLRQEVDDPEALLNRLSVLLELDVEVLKERWQAGLRGPRFRPVPLARDVERPVLERVMENTVDLPGVLAEVRPVRSFPLGPLAPHLIGYLGEVTEQELRSQSFAHYQPGDFIGKSGLERGLESWLAGQDGERRVEVDVLGKTLRILRTQEPVSGHRVYLTLRADVQEAAQQAFGDRAGAAVVLDVRTGEILAMVSKPDFDPAQFARGLTSKEWQALQNDSRHPLQNKSLRGQYPPGSVFKIVTALAALKAGVATADTRVTCTGATKLGNHTFRCWKWEGHGVTDLKKALKESCDVWFYEVAQQLGIERLAATAREFGLGEELGFLLGGERKGLIPDRQWKRARFNAPWYHGETVIAAIGQGYVLTTPLQLASMMAAVANGGTVFRPQIVRRIENVEGREVRSFQPQILQRHPVAPAHLKAVHEALWAVVNEPGGTAWPQRLPDLPYAGKTGTAQVARMGAVRRRESEIPYHLRDHALFTAFAPVGNPEIAVAVVVEHGSHGSSAAAPIARAIIARYFKLEQDRVPIPRTALPAPAPVAGPPDGTDEVPGAEPPAAAEAAAPFTSASE